MATYSCSSLLAALCLQPFQLQARRGFLSSRSVDLLEKSFVSMEGGLAGPDWSAEIVDCETVASPAGSNTVCIASSAATVGRCLFDCKSPIAHASWDGASS